MPDLIPTPSELLARIKFSAMNFLAMREHSAKELQQKLTQRFDDPSAIAQALKDLQESDLQNDERFAVAFLNMRMRQGKGPVRILHDLREKGISVELIDNLMIELAIEWSDIAKEIRQRRFGDGIPSGREKAKQMRFLQYRGFTTNQIRTACG